MTATLPHFCVRIHGEKGTNTQRDYIKNLYNLPILIFLNSSIASVVSEAKLYACDMQGYYKQNTADEKMRCWYAPTWIPISQNVVKS